MRVTKRMLRAAVLGACAPFAFAQDAPPSIAQCSVVCQRVLANEDLRQADGGAYEAARSRMNEAAKSPDFGARLNSVVAKFSEERNRLANEIHRVEDNKRAAEIVFAAADDLTVLKWLPSSTLSATVGHGLDGMIRKLEDKKSGLAGELLGPVIEEIRRDNAQRLSALDGLSPDAKHKAMFGEGGLALGTDVFSRLDAEGRADVANLKVDILEAKLKSVSDGVVHTQEQVDALVEDYNRFKAGVTQFATATQAKIKGLTDGQVALTRAYETLGQHVQQNAYRLDALEGVMWSNLTPGEQVKALQGGAFASVLRGMTPAERAEFQDDLQRAATLNTISNAADATVAVANDFLAIGRQLGVDIEEPVKRVNQAATLVKASIQIYSGEPLSVIAGLGGLARAFGGGGGPDANIQALAALRRDITLMRKEMYKYHVREMEALEAISRQIDERFSQLAALQIGALDQIGFNTLQLSEILAQDLNTCAEVRRIWQEGRSTPHDTFADYVNRNHRYRFGSCRQGIDHRFGQASAPNRLWFSTLFSLQSLGGDGNPDLASSVLAARRYRSETLMPTVDYVFREHRLQGVLGKCSHEHVTLVGLLATPKRDGTLRRAAEVERAGCAADRPEWKAAPTPIRELERLSLRRILSDPLNVTTIAEYGRIVHDIAPVWEVLDDPGGLDPKVMPVVEIRAGGAAAAKARAAFASAHLRQVLDLVNLAIAQVNLMGGDLVIDVIARDVEAGLDDPSKRDLSSVDAGHWGTCNASGSASARYFNAICILHRNEVLRLNFVRHWVRTRLHVPNETPRRRYAIGMSLDERTLLAASFRRIMPVERCGQTWCLRLPGASIQDPLRSPPGSSDAPADRYDLKGDMLLPMPQWFDVATDRQAVSTPQIDTLLALRRDISARINELAPTGTLRRDQAQFVYDALVVAEGERAAQDLPAGR